MSDNFSANLCSSPLYRGTEYMPADIEWHNMKKYHANFNVRIGRNGGWIASDMEEGIFTDGRTREELINNIHEAVECHFDVPSYEDVDIKITENDQNN